VLEGEVPYADMLGIVVGHLYQYLRGQKLLEAPAALKAYFGSDGLTRRYAAFKDDFEV
jgi:hypothetical protein